MPDDPLDILRQLAKRFKGRIRAVTFYDGNVCTWTHPPGRPWDPTPVSGQPFSEQFQFRYAGHKVRMFANPEFLRVEVRGSFTIQPLSINQENANYPLLEPAESLRIDNRQYSSFTKSGTHE